MNQDDHLQQYAPNQPNLMHWQPFAQMLLGTCALIGTGIGGILHFLNVGEGHPAYQIFVLQLSAFVITVIIFFLVLANMIIFVAELSRIDKNISNKLYLKFTLRCLTLLFTLLLAASGYGIVSTGGEFFAKGLHEYFQTLRAAQS